MAAAAVGIMVAVFPSCGQYPRARAGCCGHLGSQPYSAVGHAGAAFAWQRDRLLVCAAVLAVLILGVL